MVRKIKFPIGFSFIPYLLTEYGIDLNLDERGSILDRKLVLEGNTNGKFSLVYLLSVDVFEIGLDMRGIICADSITKPSLEFREAVLVVGSHGGGYCGYLAALSGLRGVIFNDAGVGKDRAGIKSLDYLDPLGMPAATVSYKTARIGDGNDMFVRGVLSFCNGVAGLLGCAVGQTCQEATEAMCRGKVFEGNVPSYQEGRTFLWKAPICMIACDSASLVKATDAGAIIVTGSHGGKLAGRPDYGLSVKARGAVFNDAGVGIDQAGIQRLEILNRSGIPAVTVDAKSARIGDARSAWESGILSYINMQAEKCGIRVGMTVPEFADFLVL